MSQDVQTGRGRTLAIVAWVLVPVAVLGVLLVMILRNSIAPIKDGNGTAGLAPGKLPGRGPLHAGQADRPRRLQDRHPSTQRPPSAGQGPYPGRAFQRRARTVAHPDAADKGRPGRGRPARPSRPWTRTTSKAAFCCATRPDRWNWRCRADGAARSSRRRWTAPNWPSLLSCARFACKRRPPCPGRSLDGAGRRRPSCFAAVGAPTWSGRWCSWPFSSSSAWRMRPRPVCKGPWCSAPTRVVQAAVGVRRRHRGEA